MSLVTSLPNLISKKQRYSSISLSFTKMSTYPEFLVRIDCITYNHAPYIEDAMNGFCMQQTTFPFVATIIDDASTDGEPEVIRRYLDAHFDLSEKGLSRQWETDDAYFIYAQHKENKNCYFAVVLLKYNFCSINKNKEPLIKDWINTKYVAFCEGDDYWISSSKIQKQIDFMEEHPDYGMVYTNHKQYVQSDNLFIEGWAQLSSFDDMLIANKIGTLTVCMRQSLCDAYQKKISDDAKKRNWLMGDYPLWLFSFAESKVFYIDRVTGVYRVLKESMSHFTSFAKREKFIISTMDIQLYFAQRYKKNDNECSVVKRNLAFIAYESDVNNENTKTFFLPYWLKYRFDIMLFFDLISTHNRYFRFFYHKFFGWK